MLYRHAISLGCFSADATSTYTQLYGLYICFFTNNYTFIPRDFTGDL